MSVQAISWVLRHSDTQAADRLVLLALANHAGGDVVDGAYESWPSIELICEEARLDRPRTAQDSLTRMVTMGDIERVLNGAPDQRLPRDKRPNLYRILLRPRTLAEQIGQRFDADAVARHPVLAACGVTDRDTPRGDGSRHPDNTPDPVDNHTDGVSDSDTPDDSGVSDRDATGCRIATRAGCRETTPKPSLLSQPSENPLADVTRAEPPPTPPVDTPPALRSADRTARIDDACRLIAERRAAQRDDVGAGWVHTVTANLAETYASEGHRALSDNPTLSAAELADHLEPPLDIRLARQAATAREREDATRQHLRDVLCRPAGRAATAAGLTAARTAIASRDQPGSETP